MPPTAALLALVLVLALLVGAAPGGAAAGRTGLARRSGCRPRLAGPTAALTAWIWGGLRPEATWHDEAAYRLQAELLAHLIGASRRGRPAAYTQAAVLVTPVVAPKMPWARAAAGAWHRPTFPD